MSHRFGSEHDLSKALLSALLWPVRSLVMPQGIISIGVVLQAQLDALKEQAIKGSSITNLLLAAGCKVNLQLTPPAWMFKSSMGTWMEAELLHRS